MKIIRALVSLALGTTLPLAGALLAQDQQAAPQANNSAAQSQPTQPAANTLAGRIEHKSGRYVLLESASKAQYVLDDQKIAKRYNGRIVFVTGMVDLAGKTIKVQKIEVAA